MSKYIDEIEEIELEAERPLAESRFELCVKNGLENGLALASTGAAAGVAITKLTGHSKTIGAVVGIGMSLLAYGVLRLSKRK